MSIGEIGLVCQPKFNLMGQAIFVSGNSVPRLSRKSSLSLSSVNIFRPSVTRIIIPRNAGQNTGGIEAG